MNALKPKQEIQQKNHGQDDPYPGTRVPTGSGLPRSAARQPICDKCHEPHTLEGHDGDEEGTNGPQSVVQGVHRPLNRKADRHDQGGHDDRYPGMTTPARGGSDHGEHEHKPNDLPGLEWAVQGAVGPKVFRLVPPKPAEVVGDGGKRNQCGRPCDPTVFLEELGSV